MTNNESTTAGLKVRFVAGFGPIVSDAGASKTFYLDTLGLALASEAETPDYYHSEKVDGVRHFALWPLEHAAQSCFGTGAWSDKYPAPHSWLEFDVEDIHSATEALKERGYHLLVEAREEPWGQTVTRMLSPEGILIGVTLTPWLR
jgi:catechol 2,3-dioxygenase-like lactoylglutathione lyase family enzyme